METHIVWTCSTGGNTAAVSFSMTQSYPTCPNGEGSYRAITINDVNGTPDVQAQLALIGVNAPDIAATFVFGFATYLAFWALSFAAEAAMKAIRMA